MDIIEIKKHAAWNSSIDEQIKIDIFLLSLLSQRL